MLIDKTSTVIALINAGFFRAIASLEIQLLHPAAVNFFAGREAFSPECGGESLLRLRADGLKHRLPLIGGERFVVAQLARGVTRLMGSKRLSVARCMAA